MIHYLRTLAARFRVWFGDFKADREFDDEIKEHLRLLTERYVHQGMTEADAASAARRQFGNIALLKEVDREMRGIISIETIFQDLRYGLRMLRRNPGFTLVAVLTLALGIGANTAIFSVVNAVLLRSLPYREPDQLVLVSHYRAADEQRLGGAVGFPGRTFGADFLEWRDQSTAFEQITAYNLRLAILAGGSEPETVVAGAISADLFAVLGVVPVLGRSFTTAEDTAGGPPVMIMSDSLWQRRFGGDPHVIGRALTLNGQSLTVIGIMPPGFRFPEESDLWVPLALNATKELSRQGLMSSVNVLARLKRNVTPETARADLAAILDRQRRAFPQWYSDVQVRVNKLGEQLVGKVRLALLVLFGAVACVLLIACTNVANLLLARSAARQRELAIRAAIGAGRLRLVRQLLTESLLLSLAGGVVGLLAAKWGVRLLVAMSPVGIARMQESNVDGRVLGFTFVVAVVTGLVAGLFPALQASKTDVNETLKAQSTARGARSGSGGAQRARSVLMIAELALALILLVGAGLMIKSFLRLLAVPKGFNPDGVLTLELAPSFFQSPPGSPQNSAYFRAYFQEALARIQALPGIQSAALTSSLPLAGPTRRLLGIGIEGRPPLEPGKELNVDLNAISSEYFRTMGIEMRAGRPFTPQDGEDSPLVVVINETLARRFFPNENPIGHRLLIGPGSASRTIVGVVGDAYNRNLDREVYPEVYAPYSQYTNFVSQLVVRVPSGHNSLNTGAGLSSLAAAIRNQVRAIDRNTPVNQIVTMDERLSKSVAGRRFQMLLLGIFAVGAERPFHGEPIPGLATPSSFHC